MTAADLLLDLNTGGVRRCLPHCCANYLVAVTSHQPPAASKSNNQEQLLSSAAAAVQAACVLLSRLPGVTHPWW
jgi:hypothetical protein